LPTAQNRNESAAAVGSLSKDQQMAELPVWVLFLESYPPRIRLKTAEFGERTSAGSRSLIVRELEATREGSLDIHADSR